MLLPDDAERIANEAGLVGTMRQAWLLRAIGWADAEIAAELGIELVSVRSAASRARRRVRFKARMREIRQRARELYHCSQGPESVAHGRAPVGNDEDFEGVLRAQEGLPVDPPEAPRWMLG